MTRITLTGEPRSTNHCWKHSCNRGYLHSYMTPEGKALKESYQWEARGQYRGDILTVPLALEITLYHGTRRRQDIDNYGKLLLDSLTGIVWEDDSQVTDMTVRKRYDKVSPRIEVNILPLPSPGRSDKMSQ